MRPGTESRHAIPASILMAWSCATNSLRRALSCSVQGALIKRTILSVLHRRFKAARRPAVLADSNGSMGVGRVMMLLRIRRESALIFFKTAVGAVDKKTDLPDRLFGERPVQSQLQKYSCSRVTVGREPPVRTFWQIFRTQEREGNR